MPRLHHLSSAFCAVSTLVATVLVAAPSSADPLLRHQADQRGNVLVFGSTLAHDCDASVPAPPGTTVSCVGDQGLNDTAGDLYWRDLIADASVAPTQARTSASLDMPSGANVTYARLYWAALKDGPTPDHDVTLDCAVVCPEYTVTSDHCHGTIQYPWPTHPTWYYYQCSGDATSYVEQWGAGDFRVTDIDAIPLADATVHVAFSAWTLVVFYEDPAEDLRNLALFDGFEFVDPEHDPPRVSAALSGFLAPQGFTAKMAAFMYEGDHSVTGDFFAMSGVRASNSLNPSDNFFNSSRTNLGVPVSGPWDEPAFSGEPDSMAGYDLDMIDITSALSPGDSWAVVEAESVEDKFILGGFVTSIESTSPDFAGIIKSVEDLNGGGAGPGDTLRFTISATNSGTDDAVNVVISDTLEPGLEFVPGSIFIETGGPVGPKTDQSGDDQGEFVAANNQVVVRVGTGASAVSGGTVAVNASVEIRFDAQVTMSTGRVANVGSLSAGGVSGTPEKSWETDSVEIAVNECGTDEQCTGTKPHCDTNTNACVPCVSDADCTDPAKPACQPDGSCNECSATNTAACTGQTPECNVPQGICVNCKPSADPAPACANSDDGPLCVAGAGNEVHCGCVVDSDCGGPTSGRVCDSAIEKCIDGCRAQGGNGCPDGDCSSTDSSIGTCLSGSGGSGGGSTGGSGGVAPPAAGGGESEDEGGCGCSTPGRHLGSGLWALGFGLWVLGLRRSALGSGHGRR